MPGVFHIWLCSDSTIRTTFPSASTSLIPPSNSETSRDTFDPTGRGSDVLMKIPPALRSSDMSSLKSSKSSSQTFTTVVTDTLRSLRLSGFSADWKFLSGIMAIYRNIFHICQVQPELGSDDIQILLQGKSEVSLGEPLEPGETDPRMIFIAFADNPDNGPLSFDADFVEGHVIPDDLSEHQGNIRLQPG